MKILFLTDNFPPEVNAPATRTYEHCKEWVKQGEEVAYFFCRNQFIIFKSDLTGFNPYFVRPGEGDGSTVCLY